MLDSLICLQTTCQLCSLNILSYFTCFAFAFSSVVRQSCILVHIYIYTRYIYIYLYEVCRFFSFPFSATVSSVVVSAVAVSVVAAIVLLLPAFGNHMMTLFLLLRLLTTFSHILFQLNSL